MSTICNRHAGRYFHRYVFTQRLVVTLWQEIIWKWSILLILLYIHMFALTGYQHVLLYSSHKYYKNTKVWNKLPTSAPTFIQKFLWVVLHCFCWLLKVQWKHDVGFGSKNIKLWRNFEVLLQWKTKHFFQPNVYLYAIARVVTVRWHFIQQLTKC